MCMFEMLPGGPNLANISGMLRVVARGAAEIFAGGCKPKKDPTHGIKVSKQKSPWMEKREQNGL